MKEKYIKESTKEIVLAERVHVSLKKKRKKSERYLEEESIKHDYWLIDHSDGFSSKLSDAKFAKRYMKV